MSDFKAKIHQIQFRPRPCWGSLQCSPRPCWGSLQRSPRPLAEFKGPTSKGRGKEWMDGRGPLYFSLRIYTHDNHSTSYVSNTNPQLSHDG